ncbi:RISC-loading complex subunit tarbp2 [Phlebotomus argentipes]|uniref:RISC-loading complex subunit tarbp2 n=1 Tax=Phlebotomus argentipes TaxID=94469 RepID=UPI002892FF8E|nr:RISC-loading complex subunit tarbp2 [Phlebotomus argentipes]
MAQKTPVTLLQELCTKNNVTVPFYEEAPSEEDKMFTIRVQACELWAEGSARSKQEAKHEAARNLLSALGFDVQSLGLAVTEKVNRADSDHVKTLLDICLTRDLPMAQFHCIDARGPSHAPAFTLKCEVSQLTKTATHSTKKGAKQLVAKAMIELIQEMYPDDQKILVPLAMAAQQSQERQDRIFKSYRDWKNSDSKILPGVKLADRHNYFVNVPAETYARAVEVLQRDETDKEKAFLLAKALGHELKTSKEMGEQGELVILEMSCDFETCHFGYEQHVYRDFISYMTVMMNLNCRS